MFKIFVIWFLIFSGAGQEVGRSCILLDFKGKRILLDFGIHPGLSGTDALPMIDSVDLETIDILLISQFVFLFCWKLWYRLDTVDFILAFILIIVVLCHGFWKKLALKVAVLWLIQLRLFINCCYQITLKWGKIRFK